VEETLNHPFFSDLRNKDLEVSTDIILNYEFEKITDTEELSQLIYEEMKSFHSNAVEDMPIPNTKDEELLTLDLDGTFLYIDHKKINNPPPILLFRKRP